MMKTIDKIMTQAYLKVKENLNKEFPHLYFYVSPIGELSCWVRRNGIDGETVVLNQKINVGQISFVNWRYLQELNKMVAPISETPDKYFLCTECGLVKERDEFEDSIFAASYCKKCAKKPQIAAAIKESHKRGFYD